MHNSTDVKRTYLTHFTVSTPVSWKLEKPWVFWLFQGAWKWNTGLKWVKASNPFSHGNVFKIFGILFDKSLFSFRHRLEENIEELEKDYRTKQKMVPELVIDIGWYYYFLLHGNCVLMQFLFSLLCFSQYWWKCVVLGSQCLFEEFLGRALVKSFCLS